MAAEDARAELHSLSTTLDEVLARLATIAESAAHEEQPIGAELFEIERDLQAGARRLAKLVGGGAGVNA